MCLLYLPFIRIGANQIKNIDKYTFYNEFVIKCSYKVMATAENYICAQYTQLV